MQLSEIQINELSAELSTLSNQQSDALLKSRFSDMSESEADAYNKRRLRIVEICELLANAKL